MKTQFKTLNQKIKSQLVYNSWRATSGTTKLPQYLQHFFIVVSKLFAHKTTLEKPIIYTNTINNSK